MVSSCRHSRQEPPVIWSGDIRAMSRHIRSERRVIDGTCLAFRQIILTSDVGKIDPPPSDIKHIEQGGLKQKPSRRCSCIIVHPHNINAPLPKPTQQVVRHSILPRCICPFAKTNPTTKYTQPAGLRILWKCVCPFVKTNPTTKFRYYSIPSRNVYVPSPKATQQVVYYIPAL